MNVPSQLGFRIATLALGALLGLQCIWILLAESSRPNVDHLPVDSQSATAAAKLRIDATWAAYIGGIRGDLWADSAFTYANLLWIAPGSNTDQTQLLEQFRASIDRALDDAPHQTGAWLLLAGLASHFHWSDFNVAEALKMSYYTGPNEGALMPLRMAVAVRSQTLENIDVQDFVRRDIRLLLAHQQKSAIAKAYSGATPAGQRFIETAAGKIDPSILGLLRSDTSTRLPD